MIKIFFVPPGVSFLSLLRQARAWSVAGVSLINEVAIAIDLSAVARLAQDLGDIEKIPMRPANNWMPCDKIQGADRKDFRRGRSQPFGRRGAWA